MKSFIITLLFVLAIEASLFVTLGSTHLVVALFASVIIWVGIKFEERSLANELSSKLKTSTRQISKIIPIITKEIEVLQNASVKQGVS